MYLNSDLRSDTGLKLAKEVSRCLCIQDTAPPSNPFRSQRRNDATVRPAFHGNHHSRVLQEEAAVEKLFSPRKLEPWIFSVLCVYVYVRGTDSTKRSHYGMISSVLYRLFMPFVIPDFYSTTLYAVLNPKR